MKQPVNELSVIQKLALNTISKITTVYEQRYLGVSEDRKNALVMLKESVSLSDVRLVHVFYDVYEKQKANSGFLGPRYSTLCKELAFFLFESKELLTRRFNNLTQVIMDRMAYPDVYKTNLEKQSYLSGLLAKKALMEEEMYFFPFIEFMHCLEDFTDDILNKFKYTTFTHVTTITMASLFIQAYEKNDLPSIKCMLESPLIVNRIRHTMCDIDVPKGPLLYIFKQIFMKSNTETREYIFSSPLFHNLIESNWIQQFISKANLACESGYQLTLHNDLPFMKTFYRKSYVEQLEGIKICLRLFEDKLGKTWGLAHARNADFHPALQKLYQSFIHAWQDSVGFLQYYTFFHKGQENACSLNDDLDGILKRNFVALALKDEAEGAVQGLLM